MSWDSEKGAAGLQAVEKDIQGNAVWRVCRLWCDGVVMVGRGSGNGVCSGRREWRGVCRAG